MVTPPAARLRSQAGQPSSPPSGTGAGRAAFVGELATHPAGERVHVVHGWCCDRNRPTLRAWVEILAEDRLVAKIPARTGRDDLRDRGLGDGQYGFRAVLHAEALPPRPDVLIRARVAGQRRPFGQILLQRCEMPPPSPLDGVARAVVALSDAGPPSVDGPPAALWRTACAALSRRLAGAPKPRPLPRQRQPRWTLIVPLPSDLAVALARLDGLTALAWEEQAEVIALAPPDAPTLWLLPALVENLVIMAADRGMTAAAPLGARVALLSARMGSPAALRDVMRHGPDGLLFGPSVPLTLPAWPVQESPGIVMMLPREWFARLPPSPASWAEAGWAKLLRDAADARAPCHRLVVA